MLTGLLSIANRGKLKFNICAKILRAAYILAIMRHGTRYPNDTALIITLFDHFEKHPVEIAGH